MTPSENLSRSAEEHHDAEGDLVLDEWYETGRARYEAELEREQLDGYRGWEVTD